MTTGRARPWGLRLINALGWLLLAAGAVVLLYLVYSLLFTNVETERAQDDLRQEWQQQAAPAESPSEADSADSSERPTRDVARNAGATPPSRGVALLEFARPGSDQPVVHDEPLVVLGGVGVDDLKRGPGHYPHTALPGEDGNFSVAGHRTTYGAPFFHLDALRRGDRVHVTDRAGERFTYRVVRSRVVLPDESWVIDADPLGTGEPTLTLTTCNPRFSAAERLVVHARLQA